MAKIITILGITGKQVGLVTLSPWFFSSCPKFLMLTICASIGTCGIILSLTKDQGSSVADTFIREGGWHIRGVTRDPNKASSQVWADKGVELIKGDIDDVAQLKHAFAGSNVIFAVSDFWAAVRDPAVQERAKAAGVPINRFSYDIEVQQGRNIVDAAAATLDTLERFVLSTLASAKKWSKGKYTQVYHHDAKWEAVEYLRSTYPELDIKTSTLLLALYMTNWKDFGPLEVGRPVKVRSLSKKKTGIYILLVMTLRLHDKPWRKQLTHTSI
jgi:hypothetical protein